jgi:hypothetical protein
MMDRVEDEGFERSFTAKADVAEVRWVVRPLELTRSKGAPVFMLIRSVQAVTLGLSSGM